MSDLIRNPEDWFSRRSYLLASLGLTSAIFVLSGQVTTKIGCLIGMGSTCLAYGRSVEIYGMEKTSGKSSYLVDIWKTC